MKIAMFFHGQPRCIKKTFDRIHDLILSKYNIDIYCQLFLDKKLLSEGHKSWRGINYDFDKDTVQFLKENYKPKKIRVSRPYHGEDIFIKYPNLKSYKCNPSWNDLFHHQLSLKISSNMFNWSNYDFIIKWRYDYYPINFPDLNELDPTKLYATTDGHGTFFNSENHIIESCYILPKNAKKIFNTFDDLNKNGDGVYQIPLSFSEDLLSKQLVKSKLNEQIIKLPYNQFTVMYVE
jgi:hypothetical protein